ncbi:MAG: hypothetical protein KBS76_00405 [Ruminococcus sp.]|nr:hypothetical protein [Candidatus Apopatosoma intestinale]
MKRFFSLLLVIAMICGIFSLVACGNEPAETTGSTPKAAESTSETERKPAESSSSESSSVTDKASDTDKTTESTGSGSSTDVVSSDNLDGMLKHPDYMDVNFGGSEFVFATQKIDDWDCFEISAELTGDDTILEEAIEQRNRIVEDLYSCKIVDLQGADRGALISDDIATGKHTVDFLLAQYSNATATANFLNIASLDIDLTHDWWDQKFIECFGFPVDGTRRLYTISGQFNLISYQAVWAIYMNRTRYEQLRATGTITDDVYELVDSGAWTVDAMIKMMGQAVQDVNGDSTLNYNAGDIMGMTTYNNGYAERGFFFGVGGRGAVIDPVTGYPTAISAENFEFYGELGNAVKKAIELTGSGFYQPISGTETYASFTNGRTLFVSECLGSTKNGDSEDANFTILPFPKYNETQESYYHYVCDRAYGLKVSAAVTARDDVAKFLEVFAFHSKQIVYPAYLTYYATQIFRGERTVDMLDLVLRTKVYDPDYWFRGGSGIVGLCSTYLLNKKDTGYSRAIVANAAASNDVYAQRVEALRKLTY